MRSRKAMKQSQNRASTGMILFGITLAVAILGWSPLAAQELRFEDTPERAGEIRTINAPVTTRFGTYTPYRVPKVVPTIGTYEGSVRSDLKNVLIPEGGFSWNNFTGAERGMLVRDHVVLRNEPIGTFAQAYNQVDDLPDYTPFITVDAAMNGLRVTSQEVYNDLVRNRLAPELDGVLSELSRNVGEALKRERSDDLRQGLGRLLAYVETGRALLDPSVEVDPRVAGLVADELDNVAAGNRTKSDLLGRTFDYSRLRAEIDDTELARYQRARRFLAEAGPRAGGPDHEVMVAALMARMVDALDARSRERLDDIVAVESFFLGRTPAMMPLDAVASGMRSWYGFQYEGGFGYLDGRNGVERLRPFLAKHRSQGVAATMQTGLLPREHPFGVMTGDAENLADMIGNVDRLGTIAPEEWVGTNEAVALYTSSILLEKVPGGRALPSFMRSSSWEERRTESALGSFVGFLTPGTLLQVDAQTAHGRTVSGTKASLAGYVEPDPAGWGAVASYARYLIDGLADGPRGRMIDQDLRDRLLDIERSSANFMVIAAAELAGTSLTAEQERFLATVPARIASWEASLSTDAMRLTTGGTLGSPRVIFVLVPVGDGTYQIARGAVYDQRRAERDDVHAVANAAVAYETPSIEPAPALARVNARSASTLRLDIEQTVVRRSEGAVWFTLFAEGYDRIDVVATVVDQEGRVAYTSRAMPIEKGERFDMIPTDDLRSGHYFVRIGDLSGRTLASGRFMVVR